jgi:hypothetical protein
MLLARRCCWLVFVPLALSAPLENVPALVPTPADCNTAGADSIPLGCHPEEPDLEDHPVSDGLAILDVHPKHVRQQMVAGTQNDCNTAGADSIPLGCHPEEPDLEDHPVSDGFAILDVRPKHVRKQMVAGTNTAGRPTYTRDSGFELPVVLGPVVRTNRVKPNACQTKCACACARAHSVG